MSHTALRRVMIRLLHDPAFVDALYADAPRALADADVDPNERAWLVATPRAAWGTDPERPARVLQALRDEYPVTMALAPACAARFFASAAFHAAVQARGSLALALGEHLQGDLDRRVAAAARVEAAIAQVRRAPPPTPTPPPMLRLTPHVALLSAPAGTLALLAACRQGDAAPALGDGNEAILVVRDGDGATLEALPPDLASLLALAVAPQPREALQAAARTLGADPGEDAEIVDGLVADGLLV